MNQEIIKKLTNQYLKSIEQEWAFLHVDEKKMVLRGIFTELEELVNGKPNNRVRIEQVIQSSNHVVFLGGPGSGKSTLLQYIGLCFARKDWVELGFKPPTNTIPVKLELNRFASILSEPGPKLEYAVSLAINEYIRDLNQDEAIELTLELIKQKKVILLLDGLDEVRESLRNEVQREIRRFSESPNGKSLKIIVSTRRDGFSDFELNFPKYLILPLDDKEKLEVFVSGWIETFKPEWDNKLVAEKKDIFLSLMNSNLSRSQFKNNPLLLRLSVQVFINSGELEKVKSMLYNKYLDDLFERAIIRGLDPSLKASLNEDAEKLAWELQLNKKISVSTNTINLLQDKLGLIIVSQGVIEFSHKTIQEYLVGRMIGKLWKTNRVFCIKFIRSKFIKTKWREPIIFMSGELGTQDNFDLQSKILSSNFYGKHRKENILFILKLIDGGAQANPIIKKEILQKIKKHNLRGGINQRIGTIWESYDLISEAGTFGNDALPILLEILEKRNQEINNAKNTDEVQSLVYTNETMESAVLSSLAKINSLESIKAIEDLFHETRSYVTSKRAIEMLGYLKVSNAIPEMINMINTGDLTWGMGGVHALVAYNSLSITTQLLEQLKNIETVSDIASLIFYYFKFMGEKSIPYALKGLEDRNPQVRIASIRALEHFRASEAIPKIQIALGDKNLSVCECAIYALSTLGAKSAIKPIEKILFSKNEAAIRGVAAFALAKLDPKNMADKLYKVFTKEKDEYLRESIHEAIRITNGYKHLQVITTKKDVENSFLLMRDEVSKSNYIYGYEAGRAIKKIEDQRKFSVNFLIKKLNEDMLSQITAIKLLTELREDKTIDRLSQFLKSENQDLRTETINSLAQFNTPQSIEYLRQALELSDKKTKTLIIEKLGDIHAYKAIPDIKLALKDNDLTDVAAIALGKMRVLEAIPFLRMTQRKIPSEKITRLLNRIERVFNSTFGRILNSYITFRFREDKRDYGGIQNSPHYILQGLISEVTITNESDKELLISELKKLKNAGVHTFLVVKRLEELEGFNTIEEDPFVLIANQKKVLRYFLRTVASLLIVGVLVLIGLAQDIIGDSFLVIFGDPVKNLVSGNLVLAVAILIILAIVSFVSSQYLKDQ